MGGRPRVIEDGRQRKRRRGQTRPLGRGRRSVELGPHSSDHRAVGEFAQKGPAATSIRDVAAHAGINHGLLHRHFGNKEQLVGAVLNHLGEHLADLIAAAPGEIEAPILDGTSAQEPEDKS